jgi:heptosyltransferase-2
LQHLKRILVVRTDRLGDVILTLPMLPVLRKRFPDSHIALLLRAYSSGLVEGNPYLNETLLYDDAERRIPFGEMLKTIRDRHFDAVVLAKPTPRLAWLMFRAGIPLRVGTGYRYYSLLFNRRVYEHRKDSRRHELEYNLNLLREIDCPIDGEPEFLLVIPKEVEAKVDSLLSLAGIEPRREVFVIHPGTGGSAKEWPAKYFGQLAARLLAEREAQIIVTGVKGEEEKISEIVKLTHGKAVPLVSRLSVKELAAVIKRARVFISNSTGPLHIAVAVGTPVVATVPQLTSMSPARWGPYTSMKRVLVPDRPDDCSECSAGNDQCSCMKSIPVDRVYDAVCSLLAEFRTKERVANA